MSINIDNHSIPAREAAAQMLAEAAGLNPGPWIEHSRWAARGAELIAEKHPGLDPERAYVLGLLHDIGRREGVFGMLHAYHGYHYLMALGYAGAARICITHSYSDPLDPHAASLWDGSAAEWEFVRSYLAGLEYDDYDRLILLCDCIALPTGFCLMEKRLMDVALRYGVNEHTVRRWKSMFAVKEWIETAVGGSIYGLLPGVVENTFEKA